MVWHCVSCNLSVVWGRELFVRCVSDGLLLERIRRVDQPMHDVQQRCHNHVEDLTIFRLLGLQEAAGVCRAALANIRSAQVVPTCTARAT